MRDEIGDMIVSLHHLSRITTGSKLLTWGVGNRCSHPFSDDHSHEDIGNILLFVISTFLFIGCDRVTKDLAREHLANKPAISYLHDTFKLEYVENTGAAMSLGDHLPKAASIWLLSILPLTLLVLLSIYAIKKAPRLRSATLFSVALIVAGGIGNIIDRIFYDRHVTDFMLVSVWKLHTGIFNVADVCVTAGAVGLLLFARAGNSEKLTGVRRAAS